MKYEGCVNVDFEYGVEGDEIIVGTPEYPVNNLKDALKIAKKYK